MQPTLRLKIYGKAQLRKKLQAAGQSQWANVDLNNLNEEQLLAKLREQLQSLMNFTVKTRNCYLEVK